MAIYDAPESLHVGNGVETVFGFNWPYLLPRDLLVTVNGLPVPTVLASPNQVAIVPAPAALSIVRIYRNTPAQNPTYLFATGIPMLPKYIDGNNKQLLYALQEGLLQFSATQATADEALEAARQAQASAADAAASAAQQARDMRRTLRVPTTDPEIPVLPPVASRAGKVLGFDGFGNPVGLLPQSGSGTELALDLANGADPVKNAGMIGLNRTPISAAVGSLAKAVPGIPVNIWEYEHLVTVKPHPTDVSTWNWAPALLAAINSADGLKHLNICVPMNISTGNVKVTGKGKWSLSGGGTIRKITANSMFELYECPDVTIHHLGLNGNIVWDEATNGSILPGVGRTAYACGVYAQQCDGIRILDCDLYDFANDPISIRGKYSGLPGSANATLLIPNNRLAVLNCNIYNYRNTAVYLAGIHNGTVAHNTIYTTDDFGYIRGNGIYLVDWCRSILCFDNRMERIGDNGIGVGEVRNPLAQNRHITLLDNYVNRCVYMAILVAGGEDVLVYGNTLIRGMMQQALLPEAFIIPGNPGSLQVRGGNTSKANRVRVIANTVEESYQRGIYIFDDAAVLRANWSTGIECSQNTVRASAQQNIYVNMANPVAVNLNLSDSAVGVGIFTSGAHTLFMNRVWNGGNHGILASQLSTFPGQAQNPTLAFNECWGNAQNGAQVLGGALTQLYPPRPRVLYNKCWDNGKSGTTLGGKAGLRVNAAYHPLLTGNECWDNFGPGAVVDSCTNYVVEGVNIFTNNGHDTSLTPQERAGLYVICTATAFRAGRIMSNKFFAGGMQQVSYAAAFDTTGQCICIGNEPDQHAVAPTNFARKSWADIYNNV